MDAKLLKWYTTNYNFRKLEKPPIIKLVSGIISGFRILHLVIDWILQLRDKPCVQNDIIVRWDIGRRNQFIKVYGYKRQKWIAYVLYQRHESIKTNLHSINQKPRHIASTKKQSTEHQPNNSAHSIRLFLLVSLVRKLILFPTTQTTLSFCAEPKAKSQNPSSKK